MYAPTSPKGQNMKNLVIEAFKSGVLYNMITKARQDQQGDKEEFQANPGDSSDPNDPKGKKVFAKDVYPRDQRIDHALDAIDFLSLAHSRKRGGRK